MGGGGCGGPKQASDGAKGTDMKGGGPAADAVAGATGGGGNAEVMTKLTELLQQLQTLLTQLTGSSGGGAAQQSPLKTDSARQSAGQSAGQSAQAGGSTIAAQAQSALAAGGQVLAAAGAGAAPRAAAAAAIPGAPVAAGGAAGAPSLYTLPNGQQMTATEYKLTYGATAQAGLWNGIGTPPPGLKPKTVNGQVQSTLDLNAMFGGFGG